MNEIKEGEYRKSRTSKRKKGLVEEDVRPRKKQNK